MSTPSYCPADDELRAYSINQLIGAKLRAVRGHVARCLRCQRVVGVMEPTDKAPALADEAGLWSATDMDSTVTACQPSPSHREVYAPHIPGDSEPTVLVGDNELDLSFLDPPVRSDAIGRIGHFDIFGLLGQGGMGVVFRGFDASLNRPVAVKVLTPRLASSERARKKFHGEARSAAMINHPNVVTIHAVDHQKGMPYLVMECINGRSLRERIRQSGCLTPTETLRIGLQIASGLAAAHAQGVIHRDIKPANIMLEDQVERVKITDFGLALAALQNSEMTSLETIVGTPAYMSPEQVRGELLDPRSDLFSLGCVMYAMLAGHSPFQGAHALDTVRRVTDEEPRPLVELSPDVPRPLADLIMRLLSKDPGRRPGSASEVAEAIRRQLVVQSRQQAVLETTSTIPVADLRRRERRRRLLGNALRIIGALTLTVAILAAALLVIATRRTPEPAPRPGGPPPAPPLIVVPPPPRTGLVHLVTPEGDTSILRGLDAALDAARPGSTLRLLDQGVYNGPFDITDPIRLRGVTIEGRPGAVLVAPGKDIPAVVTVGAVADVTLRALEIRSEATQFALKVRGASPGLLIDEVRFLKPADPHGPDYWSHALVGELAQGTAEEPIRFRKSIFDPWPTGLVLQGTYGEVAHVVVERCRFLGISERALEMIAPVHDVKIADCQFVLGRDGIYLDALGRSGDSGRIEIVGNRFLGVPRWVNPTNSLPEVPGLVVVHNAIFDAETIDVRDGPLSLSQLQAQGWRFDHNWWETPLVESTPLATALPDLGVISRDPDSPDFLRPGPGSPLVIDNP